MRFLEDHELPEWERERRKNINEAIDHYRAMIAKEWNRVEPAIVDCIKRGDYDAERWLRSRTHEIVARLEREIAYLMDRLPPWMECRADEILEKVAHEQ